MSVSNEVGLLRKQLKSMDAKLDMLRNQIGQQNVLIGNLQAKIDRNHDHSFQESEFQVFSQFGDDGLIQYLLRKIDFDSKTFIEFGVENYTESNTRFLLFNNNWKGLILDGSEQHMNFVKNEDFYWRHDLTAVAAFVDKDNINDLFVSNGFEGDLGILHIDIDGNDYFVWESISVVNPEVVIVEYNSVFGCEKPWSVAYDPKFIRGNYNSNNLYWGCSLLSLCDLAEEKGYDFIGCNDGGNNAYFVRKDKMKNLKKLSPSEGYRESKFRESRDDQGNLTYISGEQRLQEIVGMDIYNTRTKQVEKISTH